MPGPSFPATAAPPLETARLILRAHRAEDLEACAALWGDPETTRHIGGKPSTREESWWRILRYAGLWPLLGFGYWAVEDKASGRFVGDVGFADFKRDLEPSFEGAPEIGWVLAGWAQGRGYATEAARAALAWLDAARPGETTYCMVDPEHRVSIRVAEKCGFREFARSTYRGAPTLLLKR